MWSGATYLRVECKRGFPALRGDDFADAGLLCQWTDAIDVLERLQKLLLGGIEAGCIL
jgi:hypothetical protein